MLTKFNQNSIVKKFWHQQRTWLVMLLVAGILLFAQYLGLADMVKSSLTPVFLPLLKFNLSLSQEVASPFRRVAKMHQSAYRVQDLEFKLVQAEAQLGKLHQLEKENQELKEILQNSDRSIEQSLIATPVLTWARPAIAAGEKQGVNQGAPVLAQNTLVGRVSQVEEQYSYVELLKNKSVQPVLAETDTGVQGLVKGDGRRVILTELPTETEVNVGQKVVSLGQEGISPGLYIGEIVSIQSGHSAAVKQAVVEQYVSFYQAVAVEVR